MLSKIIWTTIFICLGLGLIVYTEPIKRFTGSFELVEKYLGSGGTYTFLKFFGLLIIIIAFLFLTDRVDLLIPDFLRLG